jgi:hypothetical protein
MRGPEVLRQIAGAVLPGGLGTPSLPLGAACSSRLSYLSFGRATVRSGQSYLLALGHAEGSILGAGSVV